jgi:hypothetical protein
LAVLCTRHVIVNAAAIAAAFVIAAAELAFGCSRARRARAGGGGTPRPGIRNWPYFTNWNYLGAVKLKVAGISVPVAKKT